MNKINILDSTIFNRIAAGEVVEKPASVLKELLDNAIDAKATQITINVLEGGIKQIEVIDNGGGIEYDDLERAFLPHATSKIKTLSDLDKIGTLGFRGEALASIGAVSEVELVSKTSSSEFGGKICVRGGKMEQKEIVGAQNGTKVKVCNIFYNVPARAKFLKKPRQEASEISNVILRYILANPFIKFTYNLDDKEIYSSTGNGLLEAIYTVYGKSTTEQVLEVNYTSSDNIKVSGYIGIPTFAKPNRTYQTLIVNGRYVQNSMVSLCVYNAFEHYLMKNQFPFFVLNIDMPLESLDVNVHPNKMDIRFENSNHIYGIVYQAVMQALSEHSSSVVEVEKKVIDFEPANTIGVSFGSSQEESKDEVVEIITPKQAQVSADSPISSSKDSNIKFYESLSSGENKFKQSNFILSNVFEKMLNQEDEEVQEAPAEENQTIFSKSTIQTTENSQMSFLDSTSYNFVGTLFETYLIVQSGDDAYFIDQHAAHERLLFDKLSKQVNDRSVSIQGLLIPYVVTVNSLEKQFLEDNLENLQNLGFDIAEFGTSAFKVSTIPSVLAGINLNNFFSQILSELSVFKQLKQADLILNKLMQHSCKTAVKAGDKLSNSEVASLIKQVEETGMVLQCPHGRPVVIKLSRKEMEKWFKRTL